MSIPITLNEPQRRIVFAVKTNLDRVGATASLLCAIHCVSLPILFALIPALGVAWLDNVWVDRSFLVAALSFALSAHPAGYLKHRKCLPMLLASVGLTGIVLAISLWEGHPAHHYAVAVGGLLVASSHFLNRHLCHNVCHERCHRNN